MFSRGNFPWNRAVFASIVFGACTGTIASDEPPCATGAGRAAYDAAFALGDEAVRGARCTGPGCAPDARPAIPVVSDAKTAACVLQGAREGMRHGCARDAGAPDSTSQCAEDGSSSGRLAGIAFCDLSIALGGLGVDDRLTPAPASLCSCAFESACQRAFDDAIARYAELVGQSGADCTRFATGTFLAAYEVARVNQCLFAVGEPGMCQDGACECPAPPPDDGGLDGGRDAGSAVDGGADAGRDAGLDAGPTPHDAGTPAVDAGSPPGSCDAGHPPCCEKKPCCKHGDCDSHDACCASSTCCERGACCQPGDCNACCP